MKYRSDVENYLSKLTLEKRTYILKMISDIQENVPESELTISYGIPCFKYKGKYLIGIGAAKNHYALYPGGEPIEILEDQLSHYSLSRGTIRFTEKNEIPKELLKEIVALCKNRIENSH